MISLVEYLKKRLTLPGQEVIGYDEISNWPEKEIRELEDQGCLCKTDDADGVKCDQCASACYMSVEIRNDSQSGNLIGSYFCEDEENCGRIEIDLIRLQQWRINKDRLFPNQVDNKIEHEANIIKINLKDFNSGSSKKLLGDLIQTPRGVLYNPAKHGKKQPGTLKEIMGKKKGYEKARDVIEIRDGTIRLKQGFCFISK